MGGFAGLSIIAFFYVTAFYLPEECDDDEDDEFL